MRNGAKPKPGLTKSGAERQLLHRTTKWLETTEMTASISSFLDRISMMVGAATLLAALPVAAYAMVSQTLAG